MLDEFIEVSIQPPADVWSELQGGEPFFVSLNEDVIRSKSGDWSRVYFSQSVLERSSPEEIQQRHRTALQAAWQEHERARQIFSTFKRDFCLSHSEHIAVVEDPVAAAEMETVFRLILQLAGGVDSQLYTLSFLLKEIEKTFPEPFNIEFLCKTFETCLFLMDAISLSTEAIRNQVLKYEEYRAQLAQSRQAEEKMGKTNQELLKRITQNSRARKRS